MVRVNINTEDVADTRKKAERSNLHVAINRLPVQSKSELLCRLITGEEITEMLRAQLNGCLGGKYH